MSIDAKHAVELPVPRKSAWQRGRLLAALAVLVAILLLGHQLVPNRWGNLGSLLETFLPWLGLAVPLLFLLALVRRSATAVLFALVPLGAWVGVFGPQLLPESAVTYDLTVVQHNVSDENDDLPGTVEVLLASDADLIALEELTDGIGFRFEEALAQAYPHHAMQGTVGLWSRYPLADVAPVDLRPTGINASWDRGLRATAQTPSGEVAVYVAHLPSARVGWRGLDSAQRDQSIAMFGGILAAEDAGAVLVLGDLNTELRDRALGPVLEHADAPEHGLGLTFPALFPVVRVDQVLAGGGEVVRTWTLPRTGSDHLPLAAYVSLPDAG